VQERCDTSLAEAIDLKLVEDTALRPLEVIAALLVDIAAGVEHLHSKSVLHGDLKPDNVLLKV
jgi:serine/threonine protein kinase